MDGQANKQTNRWTAPMHQGALAVARRNKYFGDVFASQIHSPEGSISTFSALSIQEFDRGQL